MRIARITGFAAFAILLSARIVSAQGPTAAPPFQGFGFHGHFGGPARVVTGEPYSAVRTTTVTQTLSNGTTINRTTTANESRDSNGRIYRATQVAAAGSTPARTFVEVLDPVNHVATSWRSDSKQAFSHTLPNLQNFRGRQARAAATTSGTDASAAPDSATAAAPGGSPRGFHHQGPAPTIQQLGTKTVDGVEATGTRSTIVIPAGTFGNSQPITVTHERWVSSDLGITVQETDSDPRNGVRTTTVSNLQRGEPDAALFEVPQGYTVSQHMRGGGGL